MGKPDRKQREEKRKKYDIIQAALSAFASKGFHGATMAEISAESQFPLATIYKLFGSKEKIYFELLIIKGSELTSLIEISVSDQNLSPEQKLRKSIETHYDFCINNKEFTKIYLEERQRLGSILPWTLKEKISGLLAKLLNIFTAVFQEGIDKGKFKPYSSKEAAELFIGMISTAVSSWLINNENSEILKKRLDTSLSVFIGGVSIH